MRLTWFITNRVPAKADLHCSLTLEYYAFASHKERVERGSSVAVGYLKSGKCFLGKVAGSGSALGLFGSAFKVFLCFGAITIYRL